MFDCIFCDIVNGDAWAEVIRETSNTLAFAPLRPVTPGHTLVIPKRHVADFTEDPGISGITMYHAAQLAETMGPVNLITSKGREATQSVFHLHIHLVPRRKDDGLALPWYSGRGNHG